MKNLSLKVYWVTQDFTGKWWDLNEKPGCVTLEFQAFYLTSPQPMTIINSNVSRNNFLEHFRILIHVTMNVVLLRDISLDWVCVFGWCNHLNSSSYFLSASCPYL